MRRSQQPIQQLDRHDPTVARFVAECGLSEHAVSIRLVGVTEADIRLQITRLEKTFGSLVMMTAPRQSGRGSEWIAYGTIMG